MKPSKQAALLVSSQVSRLGNTLDLDHRAISWRNGLQARSRRHGLRQEIDVNLIHRSKILHVREVDIVLDDLLERRARQFQHFFEVLQDFALWEGSVYVP